MADVIMGVTEVAGVTQASISGLIQSYLYEKTRLLPTITDYSSRVAPGDKSVSIGRSGGFTVGSKSENTALEAQSITYGSDTITLENHRAVQFLVEDIANIQSVPFIVEDAMKKASADLAVDIDTYIVAELAKASASAPDHQVVFADTSTDVVALADILAARKLLQAQHLNTDECYIGIGPEKEAEMLAISNFIEAQKWGSNEPIMNGVIGKLYGMKVVVSSLFTDRMITYHPSAVGFAFQQAIAVEQQRDLANLGTRYSLSLLHGCEVLDSGKRTVLTDSTN